MIYQLSSFLSYSRLKYFVFFSLLLYSYVTIGDLMGLKFTIKEFADQGKIPEVFTCDGSNRIPTINWQNVPKETISLVLIMDDPDAPKGTWDHWLVFNIPATVTTISQQQPLPKNALNGKNSSGTLNYVGPCPPDREHRYFFTLYALDTTLKLSEGASKSQILQAMQKHILEQVTIIGLYDRPRKK
jgi:hypothetical protein